MKVQLLLLEGIEKEIEDEIRDQLTGVEKLSGYDKVLAELKGEDEENHQQSIFVDVTKFFKTTDFYFKKSDVKGLFMSTKMTKFNHKIMVLIIGEQDYECIFEELIFEEIKEFLNN